MGRPQPRAGEHRHRQLRHHAHVDPDRRALLDPELLQCIGELDNVTLQIRKGNGALLIDRLAFPVVGDLVAATSFYMPVDAVVADVQLAA